MTRPIKANGLDLPSKIATTFLLNHTQPMQMLYEDEAVYDRWLNLIHSVGVRGVKTHDARLAAIAMAHGIENILTFNFRDFARFHRLNAIEPRNIVL